MGEERPAGAGVDGTEGARDDRFDVFAVVGRGLIAHRRAVHLIDPLLAGAGADCVAVCRRGLALGGEKTDRIDVLDAGGGGFEKQELRDLDPEEVTEGTRNEKCDEGR